MILMLCFHEQNYVKCRLSVTFTFLKDRLATFLIQVKAGGKNYQLYSDCTFNILPLLRYENYLINNVNLEM